MRYEYQCKDCGTDFDIIAGFECLNFSLSCPDCHSKNIKRIWNIPHIIYKGVGWGNKKEGEKNVDR